MTNLYRRSRRPLARPKTQHCCSPSRRPAWPGHTRSSPRRPRRAGRKVESTLLGSELHRRFRRLFDQPHVASLVLARLLSGCDIEFETVALFDSFDAGAQERADMDKHGASDAGRELLRIICLDKPKAPLVIVLSESASVIHCSALIVDSIGV